MDFVRENKEFLEICAESIVTLFQGLDYNLTVLDDLLERVEKMRFHLLFVVVVF